MIHEELTILLFKYAFFAQLTAFDEQFNLLHRHNDEQSTCYNYIHSTQTHHETQSARINLPQQRFKRGRDNRTLISLGTEHRKMFDNSSGSKRFNDMILPGNYLFYGNWVHSNRHQQIRRVLSLLSMRIIFDVVCITYHTQLCGKHALKRTEIICLRGHKWKVKDCANIFELGLVSFKGSLHNHHQSHKFNAFEVCRIIRVYSF